MDEDNDWIENSIDILRHLWPGHARHFELDEFDHACEWVGQADRTTVDCTILPGTNILQVEPDPGKALTEDDFSAIRETVDAHLQAGKELEGILIATRQFPGWEGFGALASHLKFVRDQHRKIKRVALVTDSPLGSFADHAVDLFVSAEIRSFDFDQRQKALDWLTTRSLLIPGPGRGPVHFSSITMEIPDSPLFSLPMCSATSGSSGYCFCKEVSAFSASASPLRSSS